MFIDEHAMTMVLALLQMSRARTASPTVVDRGVREEGKGKRSKKKNQRPSKQIPLICAHVAIYGWPSVQLKQAQTLRHSTGLTRVLDFCSTKIGTQLVVVCSFATRCHQPQHLLGVTAPASFSAYLLAREPNTTGQTCGTFSGPHQTANTHQSSGSAQ